VGQRADDEVRVTVRADTVKKQLLLKASSVQFGELLWDKNSADEINIDLPRLDTVDAIVLSFDPRVP